MSYGEAAAWMAAEYVKLNNVLYQEHAAAWLTVFESGQTHSGKKQNLLISPKTLDFFKGITPNIVWDFNERCWRERFTNDKPGREQKGPR